MKRTVVLGSRASRRNTGHPAGFKPGGEPSRGALVSWVREPGPVAALQAQLRSGEGVRDGLVRVAGEWIQGALARIDRPLPHCAAEDLHQVRVTVKRLRALLRLVRPVIGKSLFRQENIRLKAIANRLAPFRDAVVFRRTLERLARSATRKQDQKAIALLLPAALGALSDPAGFEGRRVAAMLRVRQGFLEAADSFENMLVRAEDWEAVGPGLCDTYRRGRNRMLLALRRGCDEAYHDWRKQVKYLYYQLQLLRPASPKRAGAMVKRLRQLEECLGEDHDLTVAAHLLSPPSGSGRRPRALRRVLRFLQERREQLRRESEVLGTGFFRDKPARFAARLNRDWAEWRSGRQF